MKTSRLKINGVLLFPLLVLAQGAWGLNTFECVRDLLAITEQANLSGKRTDVEDPVLINEKYLVFPEIKKGVLTGFYVYGAKGAKYYDAVQFKRSQRPLTELTFKKADGIYDLVAQPEGLETVIVPYLPGFKYVTAQGGGPVMLGSSVLPVVGAFVSRPDGSAALYQNPDAVNKSDLQRWVAHKVGVRSPASVDKLEVNRTLVHLTSIAEKDRAALYKPLQDELRLRKAWIQKRNLDEKTFKQFSLAIEGSCKD